MRVEKRTVEKLRWRANKHPHKQNESFVYHCNCGFSGGVCIGTHFFFENNEILINNLDAHVHDFAPTPYNACCIWEPKKWNYELLKFINDSAVPNKEKKNQRIILIRSLAWVRSREPSQCFFVHSFVYVCRQCARWGGFLNFQKKKGNKKQNKFCWKGKKGTL